MMKSYEFCISNSGMKYFLGERPWTKNLKADHDNWQVLYRTLDKIVKE